MRVLVADVPGGRRAAVERRNGVLHVLVDQLGEVDAVERTLAAGITGIVAAANGVPAGDPVLTANPEPTTGTDLVLADHRAIATLTETIRQLRAASGPDLVRLRRLLAGQAEQMGIGPDAEQRETLRALLPDALNSDLTELLDTPPDLVTVIRSIPTPSIEDQYWGRMRRLSNPTGWIPPEEKESPPRPAKPTPPPKSEPIPPPYPAKPPPEKPEAVVVAPGDTLWDIVETWLGSGATDAEVLHWVRAWYAANRSVIGRDPDLIYPGQRLLPPPKTRVR